MVSETNHNCILDFLEIGAFSLVNADWEKLESEIVDKTFKP